MADPSAIKWETVVAAIGPEAGAFLQEGIVVLFDTSAPVELAEFAVLHPPATLREPVVVADSVWLGGRRFRVTAVGAVANTNLATLGHLVLKCNGLDEAEMPGDVCLERGVLPPLDIGTPIRIAGREG